MEWSQCSVNTVKKQLELGRLDCLIDDAAGTFSFNLNTFSSKNFFLTTSQLLWAILRATMFCRYFAALINFSFV